MVDGGWWKVEGGEMKGQGRRSSTRTTQACYIGTGGVRVADGHP